MSFTETLILNQMYRPHEVVDWKDAVTRMFLGKVEVLAEYEEILAVVGARTLQAFPALKSALRQVIGTDAESLTIKVPAVAVVSKPVRVSRTSVRFSRRNVCLRDDFSCQYCGARLPEQAVSFDHVVPRSRGGRTGWENIVASCYPCNAQKRDRTPEEAGMELLSAPARPRALPGSGLRLDAAAAPREWGAFLGAQRAS